MVNQGPVPGPRKNTAPAFPVPTTPVLSNIASTGPRGPAQGIMKDDVSTLTLALYSGSDSSRRAAAITLIDMILRTNGDPKKKMALLGTPLFACKETHVPPHEILALFGRSDEELLFNVGMEQAVKECKKKKINLPALVEEWADNHRSLSVFMPVDSITSMWPEMKEKDLPLQTIILAVIKARGLQDGINDLIDFFQQCTIHKNSHDMFHTILRSLLPVQSSFAYDAELRDLLRAGQVPREPDEQDPSKLGVPALIEKMNQLLEPGSRPARAELFRRVMAGQTTLEFADEKRRIFLGLTTMINGDRNRLIRMLMDNEEASKPLVQLALLTKIGEADTARLVEEYCKPRMHSLPPQGQVVPFDPSGLQSLLYPDILEKFGTRNGTMKAALIAMSLHRTTEGLSAVSSALVSNANDELMREKKTSCPLANLSAAGARTPAPPELFSEHVLRRDNEPILHGRELGAAITAFLTAA